MSDIAASMGMIIFGLLLILVLLFILKIVHEQAAKVRELEGRMKLMDEIEAPESTDNKEDKN